MSSPADLTTAREAAARHLEGAGYRTEASVVRAGEGDDFVEVRIALSLLAILSGGPSAEPPVRRDRNGHRVGGEEC